MCKVRISPHMNQGWSVLTTCQDWGLLGQNLLVSDAWRWIVRRLNMWGAGFSQGSLYLSLNFVLTLKHALKRESPLWIKKYKGPMNRQKHYFLFLSKHLKKTKQLNSYILEEMETWVINKKIILNIMRIRKNGPHPLKKKKKALVP